MLLLFAQRINKATLLSCLLAFSFLAGFASGSPVTFQEISMLLRNRESEAFIQQDSTRRRLAQPLTPQQEAALTALGATPGLLQALRAISGSGPNGQPPTQSAAPPRAISPVFPEATPVPPLPHRSLSEERRSFTTRLLKTVTAKVPVPKPPESRFEVVTYRSPAGELPALLSVAPKDGKLRPAIIWMVGGWSNSISSIPWDPAAPENDQSAGAFAKAGIITMFPSLRGGNTNPGSIENFYGEVDDVIAAAEFLSRQPTVDPRRIYLGGHSTGGTLVLLVAECSDRFRAVFAFGPSANAAGYDKKNLNFDLANPKEFELRSPENWLDCIHSPTFVFEGTAEGNIDSLKHMADRTKNPMLHFFPIDGATHFTVLAPMTQRIASKIETDVGISSDITFLPNK